MTKRIYKLEHQGEKAIITFYLMISKLTLQYNYITYKKYI